MGNKKILAGIFSLLVIFIICLSVFIFKYIDSKDTDKNEFIDSLNKESKKYKKQQQKEEAREKEGIEEISIPKGLEIYKNKTKLNYKVIKKANYKLGDNISYIVYESDMKLPKLSNFSELVFKFNKLKLSIPYSDKIKFGVTGTTIKTEDISFFRDIESSFLVSLKALGEVYYKKDKHINDYSKFMSKSVYSKALESNYPDGSRDYVDPNIIPKITEKIATILDEDHILLEEISFSEEDWDYVCWGKEKDKWIIVDYE
jgi:hypothetical protein